MRFNRQSEHSLQIALSVRVAEKVEGPNVHGRKIVAVFMGASGRRYDNHRDFHPLPSDVPDQLPVCAILEPESAETSGYALLGERVLRGLHALQPNRVEGKCFKEFCQTTANLRVNRGYQDIRPSRSMFDVHVGTFPEDTFDSLFQCTAGFIGRSFLRVDKKRELGW